MRNENAKKNENTELTILATKLPAETAKAFREYASKSNTTVSRLLSDFVKTRLGSEDAKARQRRTVRYSDYTMPLTESNFDLLKREAARKDNPGLSPDAIGNMIISHYFQMVEDLRG